MKTHIDLDSILNRRIELSDFTFGVGGAEYKLRTIGREDIDRLKRCAALPLAEGREVIASLFEGQPPQLDDEAAAAVAGVVLMAFEQRRTESLQRGLFNQLKAQGAGQ